MTRPILTDEDTLPHGFRLFRVDVGAVYWVISKTGTPDDVQRSIEDVEGVGFCEEQWDPLTSDDIRELTRDEALRANIIEDGEPAITMWAAAMEQASCNSARRVNVLACSEWP